MTNKITKRQNFEALLKIEAVASDKNLTDFIAKEIALLDKKNASRKNTLTDTQKENLDLKEQILEYLVEAGTEKTCSTIAKEFALSTQRTSPILEKLINEGKVEKNMVKRVNYFKAI